MARPHRLFYASLSRTQALLRELAYRLPDARRQTPWAGYRTIICVTILHLLAFIASRSCGFMRGHLAPTLRLA